MHRRNLVTAIISVTTIGVAGCSGSSNIVVSGSTNYERTWDVNLEEGDEMVLELTLQKGIYALANVSRHDNGDNVVSLETEESTTLTEQFTAPETVDYFVVLQVSAEETRTGNASLTLRHTTE
jgi:hypothetical protein